MFFSFIDTAYSLLIIPILIFLFIKKNSIPKSLLQTANIILIFYSWYISYQFYHLIKVILSISKDLPKPTTPQKVSISWFEIRYLLIIILPYFSLIRFTFLQVLLALTMLVILQWDVVQYLYQTLILKQYSAGVLFYIPYQFYLKLFHFIALFIGVYALLWLLKLLPVNRKK